MQPVYTGYANPSGSAAEGGGIELGTWFDVNVDILAYGARIWGPSTTDDLNGDRVLKLWDRGTTLRIDEVVIADTLTVGWADYLFPTPIALAPGEYAISANFINYVYSNFELSADWITDEVNYLAGYGRYNVLAGSYPTSLFNDTYYYVDLLMEPDTGSEVKNVTGVITLGLSALGSASKAASASGGIALAVSAGAGDSKLGVVSGGLSIATDLDGSVGKVGSAQGNMPLSLALSGSDAKEVARQGSIALSVGLSGTVINPDNIVQRPTGFSLEAASIPSGRPAASIPQGTVSWIS